MQDHSRTATTREKTRYIPEYLDAVDQPIITMDLDGQVLFMNKNALNLIGNINAKSNDFNVNQIFVNPSIVDVVNKNLNALNDGKIVSERFVIKTKDAIEIQILANISLSNNILTLISKPIYSPDNNQLQTANQILQEIDNILGNVVDYDAVLSQFIEFVVPQLADICGIYLLQADNTLDRVALGPINILNNNAIYEWLQNDLPNDETDGLPEVLRSGQSKLIAEVNSVRRVARAGIKSYMILPLITHRKIHGAIIYISINPQRIFDQNSLNLAQNLAKNISVYIEKNRLYKESQKLKAELEQHVAERTAELTNAIAQLKQSEQMIQTLFRISNMLNAMLDVDTILDELAKEAIRMVNGESGFAGLRTTEGMTVKKYFHNSMAIPFEYTWALGEGIPGWVLKYKVPYGTSDADNDPLIRRELSINSQIHSVICTPILDSVGEVIGFFDIRNKIGSEGFTINDQEMLLTLAPVASIAIQNALAYKQRLETVSELKESSKRLEDLAAKLEMAREEERMRISRELHDQLGQALTAMKFDLTSLFERLKVLDDDLAHKAKDIMTQLNTMIKTVRRISTELRPGMLDDLGLLASFEWQADDFQKRTGIECKVNSPGYEINLTREQSLALFRIFQEALTNVARYAGAKHVEINIMQDVNHLQFEFRDDGRGINEDEISGSQSLGLLGMRERVKHVGGVFEINGIPDQGTIIKVSIPITQNEQQTGSGDLANAQNFVSR